MERENNRKIYLLIINESINILLIIIILLAIINVKTRKILVYVLVSFLLGHCIKGILKGTDKKILLRPLFV